MTRTLLLSLTLLFVLGCNGGGGGSNNNNYTPAPQPTPGPTGPAPSPTPHVPNTDERAANDFLAELNRVMGGGQLDMYTAAKIQTLKDDYIIVRKMEPATTPWGQPTATYTAYYVGNWNSFYQQNNVFTAYTLQRYFSENISTFRYGLQPQGDGTFLDIGSGTLFSATAKASKNLAKNKALEQAIKIESISEGLQQNYGLSAESSYDLARLTYHVTSSPAGTYNMKDYDAFMKEVSGVSITDLQDTAQKGDMKKLGELVNDMSENIGTDPESLNKLLVDFLK